MCGAAVPAAVLSTHCPHRARPWARAFLGAPLPTALGAPRTCCTGWRQRSGPGLPHRAGPLEPRAAPAPAMAAFLPSEVLAGLRHQEWARLRAGGHRCGCCSWCCSCPTAQMRKQAQDGLAWLPRAAGTPGLPHGGLGPLSRPWETWACLLVAAPALPLPSAWDTAVVTQLVDPELRPMVSVHKTP